MRRYDLGMSACASVVVAVLVAAAPKGEHRQDFAADPGWEGYRNRLLPEPAPVTRQEFGHRPTRHAGGERPGEVGGLIRRSATPAWYAKVIPERTLDHKLAASGRFAVTQAGGSSGTLVGWFRHDSRGWRTPNSLAFRVDGNGGKYWVLFEYGTRTWSTGGGATFEGRYQTTKTEPFAADGTPHAWTLAYDPRGEEQDGLITFTLDGRPYTAAVSRAHKAEGAAFDRFGLFNQQITGDGLELYVDDLTLDGEPQDFAADPGWEGRGNRVAFEDRVVRPLHDFGFSPTARAGGRPGELGGIVWRDEAPAYYADRVGRLTLDDELVASGTVCLVGASSDSGVYLGWFDSAAKRSKASPEHEEPQRGLLGVLIEGPSRAGHYLRPAYRTAAGEGSAAGEGPRIRPDGAVHRWSIRYAPEGAGGRGRITVTFDGQAQVLDLAPSHRARAHRSTASGCSTSSREAPSSRSTSTTSAIRWVPAAGEPRPRRHPCPAHPFRGGRGGARRTHAHIEGEWRSDRWRDPRHCRR